MVKNRKTKAAARNLKKESGITYPRALDLVAPTDRDGSLPGYRIAGARWSPLSHRSLWIQAGPAGNSVFGDITAQVQADPAVEVSAYDFTKLTVEGPESDAAALQVTLEAIRTAAPGRSRIIVVSGRHRLRTSLEGDRLINLITEMSAEHACTFILLGGPMPAHGYWTRHFTTNESGEVREHLIHAGRLLHSAGDHHRRLQYRGVLLGTGFHDDEMQVIEADFGALRTLLVTGMPQERAAAAHSIARSSGALVWPGSLYKLADEVRDRVALASEAGEYTVNALPDPPEPIVFVLDVDAMGGGFAVYTKMMRDAFRADVSIIATARSAATGRNMLPGPVAMTVNIDRGEADVDLRGSRTRFNAFWHFQPPAPDPQQTALHAEATKASRSWPSDRRPVRKVDTEPGDELRFHGTRTVFTVRAVSGNFVVATGSERGNPVYTIIDWADGLRGGHDSWGYGAVTDEETTALVKALESSRQLRTEAENNPCIGTSGHPWPHLEIELSPKRSVYLDFKSVRRGKRQIWPPAAQSAGQ